MERVPDQSDAHIRVYNCGVCGHSKMVTQADTDEAFALVDAIGPILRGHHSNIQGVALAELVANYLRRHSVIDNPYKTRMLRRELLCVLIGTVERLVEHDDGADLQ